MRQGQEAEGVSFMEILFIVLAVAGIVLVAAEVLTGELSLLMSGLTLLAAAAAGWFLGPVAAVGAGVVVAGLGFGMFRPAMLKRMQVSPTLDNVAALVGSKAKVLQRVDTETGLIKLAGSEWTAKVEPWEDPVGPEEYVRVVRIQGATAIVRAEHELERYND